MWLQICSSHHPKPLHQISGEFFQVWLTSSPSAGKKNVALSASAHLLIKIPCLWSLHRTHSSELTGPPLSYLHCGSVWTHISKKILTQVKLWDSSHWDSVVPQLRKLEIKLCLYILCFDQKLLKKLLSLTTSEGSTRIKSSSSWMAR